MKKTLFVLLTLLAALLVFVSCDESLDADVFNSGSSPVDPVGPVDPKSIPLTLEFSTNGNVTITKTGNPGSIKYSLNGGEKTEAVSGTPIEIPANGTISFYRTREEDLSGSDYFKITCSADCYVYGNIMSLVDSVNYATETTVPAFAFYQLFGSNVNVDINPEKGELVLPATTLANSCYSNMFFGCTSLTTAPALPATTLANGCYEYMFYNCESLTTAPALPAETLANGCYMYMFRGCTSLTTAPELPAATLVNDCYFGMFDSCTGLTTAPTLPAMTLAEGCYYLMFSDCTSLTTAPTLPAITLTEGCYDHMFYACTSLTTAPTLPATTLANGCYEFMFSGCTSLTTAPELPAATLATFCYRKMFSGCSSLNYITCLATSITATDCTDDWLAGVADTGTFYRNTEATTIWTVGTNVPSGWTIEIVPTT